MTLDIFLAPFKLSIPEAFIGFNKSLLNECLEGIFFHVTVLQLLCSRGERNLSL